jgi:hypothetical protein
MQTSGASRREIVKSYLRLFENESENCSVVPAKAGTHTPQRLLPWPDGGRLSLNKPASGVMGPCVRSQGRRAVGCVRGIGQRTPGSYFFRIASGVSGCASGWALANSGNAIAVSKMRFTVGHVARSICCVIATVTWPTMQMSASVG